ncbi:hypothetical protein N7532_006793 [Penicillium argentinense]|uniref:SAM domain-containing protein n=1 Tax=Penicillium argentinense TaxID=1131581 RepID=A0A9W9FGJ6_9EURO|nr:uncharacterized protein N7532_006793 [Penicillium argentinense]KAJ5099792.1 hypothetical protein N7532_006793 [Penicillium argentinense]
MDPLTDPADWDVEEVVKVLCTSESRPWAEASNVPYPKLDDFAKALHENYITGEILLEELDKDSLRDELGIKPLGHRSGIMKAVEWLRSRSAKYQAKNAQFQQSTLVVSTEERDSPTPMAMSLGPTAQAPGTYPPQTPNTKETPRSPQAKRRIRPQLISTSGTCTALNESTSTSQEQPSSVTEHQASRTDQVPAPKGAAVTTETDKGTSSAPISTAPGITGVEQAKYEGMSKPLASTLEGDFYQQLLKRYPPGGEGSDLLPVYGDSGSEGEYDDSTLEEIEDEERDREEARTQSNAGEQPALPSLSREERLLLISQHVTAGNARWEETRLPKILHKARPMWLESERLGTRAQDKQDLAQSIASLETRMGKLQKALLEVDYHDSASFLKACANLDPTIHNMCLEKWNLATLECDQCPDPAQPPPKTPRTRKERPRPQEDESLTSESDPDSGEEIASNGIENDEDESMPIEGDDDVGNAKHQAFLARLPFSLESSSSASPRKKRRVHFGDKSQEDESASDADSTQPETSNPAKEEDLEISTPPLNAVSRVSSTKTAHLDCLPTSKLNPPMQKLKLLGTRPPYPDEIAPIFGENKSHDPGDSTPCPVNDINRVPEPHDTVLHMDVDPALFDIVSRAEPADLAASQNRLHLLAWTITGLQTHEPGQIMKHLEDYLPAHLADNVHEALMAMQQNKWHLEDRDEAESMTILRLGALYLSWYHCMFLQSQGINPLHLQGTIDALESSEFESRFPEFLDTLRRLFSAYDNWRVRKPKSSLTTSGISPIPSIVSNPRDSSSRNRPATSISAKKPKTKFAPRYLSGMQKEAKLRQDRQDALRKDLIERGLSNHDPHKQAVTLKDPVIYLHRDIGKLVKPHQLAGIQFMWRELMEPERAQGCLLAHVMGLGKTMQVYVALY